ncbi:MAG: acyl-CoA thioesterase [Deltaproteobacteria bacterium]|nr:MAG: acyl-CoA thioesterase [Deltaproteobacteria bacterium]
MKYLLLFLLVVVCVAGTNRLPFLWTTLRALLAPRRKEGRLPFRVRLLDCDLYRHLTNAQYLHYLNLGRWDLVMRAGPPGLEGLVAFVRSGLRPVVVEIDIVFRKELRYGTRFELYTRLVGRERKALFFEQHFVVDDEIHARARVKMLVLQGGRVVAPDPFLHLVSEPLEEVDGKIIRPS